MRERAELSRRSGDDATFDRITSSLHLFEIFTVCYSIRISFPLTVNTVTSYFDRFHNYQASNTGIPIEPTDS